MRSLDHFAHAVRNLSQAGRAFERLGFHLLPVARHVEIGSCNRVFQLRHTYYELVADLDLSIPLLRDKMMPRFQCGDGMAIVSLTSDDLPGDRAAIGAAGLTPDPIINARRAVPMPDGSVDETNSHCFYVWRDERHPWGRHGRRFCCPTQMRPAPMRNRWTTLALVFLTTAIGMMGFGAVFPLLRLWIKDFGISRAGSSQRFGGSMQSSVSPVPSAIFLRLHSHWDLA